MTWDEYVSSGAVVSRERNLEEVVLGRLEGRLQEFVVEDVGGELVLRGRASSHYAKQLAQHEVMNRVSRPTVVNRIEVLR